MKIINYVFIVFIFVTQFAKGQDLIYNMLPVCEKENDLKQFLHTNIKADHEYLYIFHFKPNSCPRCEGFISKFSEYLHSKGKNSILIVDIQNTKSGNIYAGKFSIENFDYIYIDTSGIFRNFVDYDKTELNVPYLYKIESKTGKFIAIVPALGTTWGKELIDSVIKLKQPMPCMQNDTSNAKFKSFVNENDIWINSYRIDNVPMHPFSQPVSYYVDSNNVIFIDNTTQNIYNFDTKGRFKSILLPNDSEYFYFAHTLVETKIIKELKEQLIARVIYLKVNQTTDSNFIEVSSSIPSVNLSYKNGDSITEYYNLAAILKKSWDGKINSIDTFNIDIHSPITLSHSKYELLYDQQLYSLKAFKGYPAVGIDFTPTDTLQNPFLESFYKNAPLIKIFNRKNHQAIGYFGSLPLFYQQKKLGYYYCSTNIKSNNNNLYILEETTGELQVFKYQDVLRGRNVFKRVQLFDEKFNNVPLIEADTFKDKLKYFQAYRPFVNPYYIEDFRACEKNLYTCVIYKTSGKLSVNKYNSSGTKLLNTYTLKLNDPRSIENIRLIPNENLVTIIAIEKHNLNYFIRTRTINL